MGIIPITQITLSIGLAAAWLRDSHTRESRRSSAMERRVVSAPPACRQTHLPASSRTTTRSEIARLERGSRPLQIHALCARPWRFFCSPHRHHCSLWGKSSERRPHFFFSAISRKVLPRPSRRAGEMNSPVLPDSATQTYARASLTPTLPAHCHPPFGPVHY